MTSITTGTWTHARNMSAEATGSIHDEAQARELGFRAALIGGSVTTAFMTPALTAQFGQAWYERGFLKQSFIHPLYESDEFRITFEELTPTEHDERLYSLSLEKRDGERHTAGYAGLARSAEDALAPWQRPDEPPLADEPEIDPAPGEEVGTVYPPQTRTVTPSDAMNASRREASGDDSPWYTERSPWGGPIVPTFMNLLIGSGGRPRSSGDSAVRAGMNGTFQLLQTGPMFCDQPYTVQSTLVEKGWSARSAFRTSEFTVTSSDGDRVAIARQKIRWMAQPSD